MKCSKPVALFFCLLLLTSSSFVFAETATGNVQNQNVVVNVNLPQGYAMIPEGALLVGEQTHSIGLGISTPLYGTEHNVVRNGQVFTEKLTGINLMMGYTWRHYLGDGLPEKGGALYWEFMTIALFVPMVGAGYEYRFNDAIRIGVGFPDMVSVRISL